jgi:hypothetical protein
MPDFAAPAVIGSPADKAVAYLLARCQHDVNFQFYMLGTESLRLCLVAEADRLGVAGQEAIDPIIDAPTWKGIPGQKSDMEVMRDRLDRAVRVVEELAARGKLSQPCRVEIHRALDWQAEE